jgi:hypothetical protein
MSGEKRRRSQIVITYPGWVAPQLFLHCETIAADQWARSEELKHAG